MRSGWMLALAVLLLAGPALAWDTSACNGGDGWQNAVGDELDAPCLTSLEAEVEDSTARLNAILSTDACTSPPCDLTAGTTVGGSGVALDGDLTLTPSGVRQLYSPDGTEEPIGIYGAPFATTLARCRCQVKPASSTMSVPLMLQEWTAARDSSNNLDGSEMACDADGSGWDTSFSDSAIAADAHVEAALGTITNATAGHSVEIECYYTRQVVQ